LAETECTKEPGVTVVICCHNSAALLPATLEHLSRQTVAPDINWEVVVVDNASTDGTPDLARRLWPAGIRASLRAVLEPRLGQGYARVRGMTEARYDIISFIDDDNWANPMWVQTVFDVMRAHPDVGALGGIVAPAFETARPGWFGLVAYLYASGPEGEPSGDVTGVHMLCGAGLNVRYAALTDTRQKGFRPIAAGRQGTALGAGDDSELTYFLRLSGWSIWIDPRLRITHFLPDRRLQWDYARRLAYGSAFATVERDALVYACKPPRTGFALRLRWLRERWFWQVSGGLRELAAASGGVLKRSAGTGEDGDPGVLQAEFVCGRLAGLLAAWRWYNARSSEIRGVMQKIRRESPQRG
jgi:glycosyltransferase involved in cell wall biosynthesis